MRRVLSLRSLAVALLALMTGGALLMTVPAPADASEEPVVVIEGGGWGHGVGLSQYGAYGQAMAGRSGGRIVKYYYRGVRLKLLENMGLPDDHLLDGETPLWVGITGLRDRTRVTFAPLNGRLFICQSDDGDGECPKDGVRPRSDAWPIDADERWSFEVVGDDRCQFYVDGQAIGTEGGCRASISWNRFSGIQLAGTQYSRGEIKIRPVPNPTPSPQPTKFHVSLAIGLEDYLYGLAEVPTGWPIAALNAQAYAGRSYAAYRYLQHESAARRTATDAGLTESRKIQCWCHIYSTAIDQHYGAYGHERQPNWPRWRNAVNRTAGRVVEHRGGINTLYDVAQAFYSSSTGGRTENSEDKWVAAVPYLRSRNDPWSLDPAINPNASWEKTVTLASLAATLGFSDIADIEIAEVYESGSPKRIVVTGTNGSTKTYTGSSFAGRVGLKSHYVRSITIDGGEAPSPPPPPPPDPPPGDPAPAVAEQIGLHDPSSGQWTLRSAAGDLTTFAYGDPADVPFTGDWDCDGDATIGLYRASTGFLYLRNRNTQGNADVEIFYGDPGDTPVAGDWNGDGCETIGVFRPGDRKFYLRNRNTQGNADITVSFGRPGDVALAGDWDGDGVDTIGVYRPSNRTLYLTNDHTSTVDFEWVYSGARDGDLVVAGDWDGDGDHTVGVYRPADRAFYLRDTFTQQFSNVTIVLGGGTENPVAGAWGL